ncbi:MAG TPA: hypothetical protein VKU41_02440, partial [Polyangiaceae bacterium]|nr:hypothetical protein [Polyangiaceae bacterium]
MTEPAAAFAPATEYTATSRVGRVIEIRVRRLASRLDVQKLRDALYVALGQAGRGAVICADLRGVGPLSREVSDAWSRAMRAANRDIARSCLLLDPSNVTFNLQIERIVRCAGNPERRLFADVDEL